MKYQASMTYKEENRFLLHKSKRTLWIVNILAMELLHEESSLSLYKLYSISPLSPLSFFANVSIFVSKIYPSTISITEIASPEVISF